MTRKSITTIICLVIAAVACCQATGINLNITQVTGDFYVYKTYNIYNGNKISANAMYLVTNDGVVMIDCPWDSTQFRPLLDSIRVRHNKKVMLYIATHFHEDRTGGLEFYRQQGIRTYTTRHTDELSEKRGMKRAEFLINRDTVFKVGQYSFQTYYPGPGHAPDNIVVWFPKAKLLYGGCLVKSTADKTLGNLSDANVSKYAGTVANVQRKFPVAKYIITGHNDWTDTGSLQHTLQMAKELNKLPVK
jgi:metallo-beta-lactamase class B